jgi:S-methylmethionine-dependent homocysteine/selenocysteine methylase
MTRYRHHLPQLDGTLFLTDGGIETTLIYHDGLDLPLFAAFPLLDHDIGTAALQRYHATHLDIALRLGTGFILESATWRASADWGRQLGYTSADLAAANRKAVALLTKLRDAHAGHPQPLVVSGCVGPRGDGYDPGRLMSPTEARDFHAAQVDVLAEAGVDQITAITMTNSAEAIGVALAARAAGVPSVISFTVETDGRLPTAQPLAEAIAEVDAATGKAPAYYMLNCAHPTHFEHVLGGSDHGRRVRGLRANASRASHAELDRATSLDAGDPQELAGQYAALRERWPWLNVFGGCCGTDHRHIEAIGRHCSSPPPVPRQGRPADCDNAMASRRHNA